MKHLLLAFSSILLFSFFNTQAQSWSQIDNHSGVARHHPICFAIGNYGYLTTGLSNQFIPLRDFHRYNASTDQWESLPDFPGSFRGYGVGTQLDGKGYIGFGQNGGGLLNDLWVYDPTTEAWTELASCPCDARAHPAFIAIDGKIFVGLGNDGGQNFDDWWEYDIATDTWAQQPDFPGTQRHHPYYFGIDSIAYVGLGHGPSIYNDWYKYDHNTDTWTQLNDLPSQGRVAGTHFAYGGKGYILAGENEFHQNNNFESEFWEYEPATDSWTQLPSTPLGDSRWAPGCFVIDSSLYFTSGENSENEGKFSLNDVWHYPLPSLLPPDTSTQDSMPVSIPTIAMDKGYTFYPNPTNGLLTVTQNSNRLEEVIVYDLQGSKVAQASGKGMLRLNLSDKPKGLYIIQVGDERDKFILQ